MDFAGEAGAGASRVDELAVLVIAEEQRADSINIIRGQGEAADDKLLLVNALELAPVAGAAGDVFAVGALGDDALGVQLAGLLEDEVAGRIDVLAVAERSVGVLEEERE